VRMAGVMSRLYSSPAIRASANRITFASSSSDRSLVRNTGDCDEIPWRPRPLPTRSFRSGLFSGAAMRCGPVVHISAQQMVRRQRGASQVSAGRSSASCSSVVSAE
jgi:hypothetical protein